MREDTERQKYRESDRERKKERQTDRQSQAENQYHQNQTFQETVQDQIMFFSSTINVKLTALIKDGTANFFMALSSVA